MKYRCRNCEELFSEPRNTWVQTGVKDPMGYKEIVDVEVCPYCGSANFVETVECSICGENEAVEKRDYCEVCFLDMESLIVIAFENFRKMHPDATEDDMWFLVQDLSDIFYNKHILKGENNE